MVALGREGVPAMTTMTEKVLELVKGIDENCDEESREMLEAACQEITTITRALRMLLQIEQAEESILDDVGAGKTKSKQMVRNAWYRQHHYREGEKLARQMCVANMTLMPELTAAKQELKDADHVELTRCVAISKRLAVWQEGLLPGSIGIAHSFQQVPFHTPDGSGTFYPKPLLSFGVLVTCR